MPVQSINENDAQSLNSNLTVVGRKAKIYYSSSTKQSQKLWSTSHTIAKTSKTVTKKTY